MKSPTSSLIDLEAKFCAVLVRLASMCTRLTSLLSDKEYMTTIHIAPCNNTDASHGVIIKEQP
jgi:hypothetical protein